jgi:hypothetical protein
MSTPVTSCSGRIIKLRPALMNINCSAFSAFMAARGFPSPALVAAIISAFSFCASFFSTSFSSFNSLISFWSVELVPAGSNKMVVKILSVVWGGLRQTLYFPYTRSVKPARSWRLCSMAVLSRLRASSRVVSLGMIKAPYLSVSGARSFLMASSIMANSSMTGSGGGGGGLGAAAP